jgi:uncharacterized glyoxalase superfamily protein PhnB
MNRSMPPGDIIPVLAYADVAGAVDWLCSRFGFAERLRIGNHRAQLVFGGGSVVVTETSDGGDWQKTRAGVMVRVADVDAHHANTCSFGAKIIDPPTDHIYGERQYSVEDLGGYRWTFSQTIADVHPQDWGGIFHESI